METQEGVPVKPKNKFVSYLKTVGARLGAEWGVFKLPVVWSWILVGAIMQWVHNIMHNYVYYLAGVYHVYGGPDDQLVDLGFEAFPDWSNLSFLPSNGCLYSLALIALVVAMAPIFVGSQKFFIDPNIHTTQMVWRGLICVTITVVLRCVSFMITILPAPAPQCSEARFDPPTTASEILFKFDTENGCSDLIFSSHMMYGITAAGIVTVYLVKGLNYADQHGITVPKWERRSKIGVIVLCACLVLMEGFSIVCQERHYSVDVWTALYACPLTWVAFYHFFPDDPAPKTQQPVIEDGIEMQNSATQPETIV
jgi:sphingomyelin synthase-related protein 1